MFPTRLPYPRWSAVHGRAPRGAAGGLAPCWCRRVLALAVGTLIGVGWGAAACRADDEFPAVDAFLARLQLTDLQLRWHEQHLERMSAGGARSAAARRLADLYAAALLAADDPARADLLRRKVERLLGDHPEAGTGALQVSLAQADYQRAEKLVLEWLEDPRAETSRDDAARLLEKVVPLLDTQEAELISSAEKLSAQLDKADSERMRLDLETRWQREQAVAARAGYLAAWAHYYAGLCAYDTPLAEPQFQVARRHFRQVLGIDEVRDYAEVDVESLGLEPLARSRSVVGLGLAEAALAQAAEADQVFRWLTAGTVHPVVREQADYWRLQSRLNARRWKEALEIAKERVPTFNPPVVPGQVSFCVSLVRTAYLVTPAAAFGERQGVGQLVPAVADRRQFADLGLQGLLRLRQINLLRDLVGKFQISVDAAAPLPLVWARGDQLFREAEQSHQESSYRAVAQLLGEALARPEAAADVATAARCRWTLGWCHYRLKDFDAAAKFFHQASLGLREHDAKTAVEAAWMAFASHQHLLAGRPSARAAAIEALESLQRDFPGTPRAQQAGLQLARLQQAGASPEESLRTLRKIGVQDPQYPSAQYEICRLEHQAWSKARQSGLAVAEGKSVVETAERYLQLPGKGSTAGGDEDERALRVGMMAAEVLAADEAADVVPRLGRVLEQLRPRAERLPVTATVLPEYYYRQLQFAQRRSADDEANVAADWLTRHAGGTAYELPALVLAARRADERIAKASADELPALQREGIRLYTRLVALWGDSPQAIQGKKNTLVANSKLGQYLYETGQYPEAAGRLNKVLAAYPQDKVLLRRTALAEQRSGTSAAALDKWRTLLAGVEKGSYDWFEAKLGQLECLAELEPAKAHEIMAQFRLLYPDLGPPEWRGKFQQLDRRLAKSSGSR